MGDGLYFIDILLLAMIAAFLIFRLRSVLGRRTGNEQQRPNPYSSRRDAEKSGADNVVNLPDRNGPPPAPDSATAGQDHGLTQVKIADPSFDPRSFVGGAQAAFGMVVEAFAQGDTASLRPLLSDDLYDDFSSAIRTRIAEEETLETTIEQIKSAEVVDGRVEGRTAFVTVRFVSSQVNVTRDADGAAIDGDPERVLDVTDIWTFARNTRSTDPNWTLVETGTPGEP